MRSLRSDITAKYPNPEASPAPAAGRSWLRPGLSLFLAIALSLTVIRLIGLRHSVVELFIDESQYWAWAQDPAFGYFSKPPLIAWVIAVAQSVCGPSEACIRSPAPIFHSGTALVIYAIGSRLYDRRVAFWAGIAFLTMPAASFSSRIISTDVPLIFFWALALLALMRMRERPTVPMALLLGVSLGLGMLSKYAMAYFLLGLALACIFDRQTRHLLRAPQLWLAFAIGLVILAPNLFWNLDADFATLRHTQGNATGGGLSFSITNALEFLAAQFGIMGPLLFGAFLVAAWYLARGRLETADRWLIAFALPPLVVVLVVAFLTRAYANWAAAAFVPAILLVAALILRDRRIWLLKVSVAFGLVAQIALLAGDTIADRFAVPGLSRPDVYQRTMGWRAMAEGAVARAGDLDARALAADTRGAVASLLYYARDAGLPIHAWTISAVPEHHFEMERPLTAASPTPVLFLSSCDYADRLRAYYGSVEQLSPLIVETGPNSERFHNLFLLSDPSPEIGPLGRCP